MLLIQPPHYFEGHSRTPDEFPLGLGYIAKKLLMEGHEVQILDIWAHQYGNAEVLREIGRKSFDMVGMTGFCTQYNYVKWLASEIKRKNRKCRIILGGPLATMSTRIALEHTAIDACVMGEGEETIAGYMDNHERPRKVKGIAFRDKSSGKIIFNQPREPVKDIDAIGFPAWDLFPMQIYLENSGIFNPRYSYLRAMNMILGRGCPYSCNFCSKLFSGIRLRSIDRVVEEIKELKRRYGIKAILFDDELALVNKKRAYELCDALEPLKVKWQCQGRVNVVDRDILKRAKKAGCVTVGYGIESGSQKILDSMNKCATVEQAARALKDTINTGITPFVQMIFGYPGESRETLDETIEFFRRIPWKCEFSVLTALPNTRVYDDAVKSGRIKDEEKYLTSLEAGYDTDQTYKSFINFTKILDSEFFELKDRTEKIIEMNFFRQAMKHPVFLARYLSPRLHNLNHHHGTAGMARLLFREAVWLAGMRSRAFGVE